MQFGLPVAELLQSGDRCDDIIAVCSGHTVALSHEMQLPIKRKPPSILGMTPINNVTKCRHPPVGLEPQPDRPYHLAIDGCHLLPLAQIMNGLGASLRADFISDAATGPATIKPKHKPGPLGRSAVDEG